jgi:hypothetical protein
MVQYPDAAKMLDGSGHSNLHLAFQHGADDRTMLGLLNHAPEVRRIDAYDFFLYLKST